MHSSRYRSRICMFKFVRTRLILLIIIILLAIFAFDYFFHTAMISSPLQDKVTQDDLIPDMNRKAAVNLVGNSPIVLTVFYECLCTDSKSFFMKHLLPSVLKEPKLITVDLVPYGKAKTELLPSGGYKFTCQHGETECIGNKFHACVISAGFDMVTQLQIITCMIKDNFNPDDINRKCCEKYGVPWHAIEECALGRKGDLLLKMHGERTSSMVPKLQFIPTILLNENLKNQAALLKNLWKEICGTFKTMSIESARCNS